MSCNGCLQHNKILRVLRCNHLICDPCCKINSWKSNFDGEDQIKCPIDKDCTELNNGVINDLPRRLFIKLSCDNCSKESSLECQWWCNDCNEIVCSYCAMVIHRTHDCNILQDESLAKETFKLCKPLSNFQDIDNQINEFVSDLAKELRSRLDTSKEVANFMNVMKNVYGSVLIADSATSQREFDSRNEKKLRVMTNILSKVDKRSTFNIHRIIETLNNRAIESFNIPNVTTVADLFFKNWKQETALDIQSSLKNLIKLNIEETFAISTDTKQKTTSEKIMSSSSNVDVEQVATAAAEKFTSANVNKTSKKVKRKKPAEPKQKSITAHSSTSFKEQVLTPSVSIPTTIAPVRTARVSSTFTLKWSFNINILHKFQNPSNLCAIPKVGVIILDSFGVHFLSDNAEYKTFKGWPPHSEEILSGTECQRSMTYHSYRNSLFVLNEIKSDNKAYLHSKIIEIKLPSLSSQSTIVCPRYQDDYKLLLGVSNLGCIFCATSSLILMIKPDNPTQRLIIWNRDTACDIECFTDFVVGKMEENKERLYFAGTSSNVYIFEYHVLANECILLKTVVTFYPPLFSFKDGVYALDKDKEMISIDEPNQQPERLILPRETKERGNILVSSVDNLLYVFNCDSHSLSKYETTYGN